VVNHVVSVGGRVGKRFDHRLSLAEFWRMLVGFGREGIRGV
jgi:hypothetical protein